MSTDVAIYYVVTSAPENDESKDFPWSADWLKFQDY